MLNNNFVKNLRGRDFLSLKDLSGEEINALLDFGVQLKRDQRNGGSEPLLQGKTLGMIFHKSSTRTRVSFEVGMIQLGGYPLYLSASELQLGRGESIADTAVVLSRYLDAVMIRTYSHLQVEELAKFADIPVINGLTDFFHPCQVLSDLMTVREYKGNLQGLKLTYIGDGNNVAHSLMYGCVKLGMDITVITPPGYEPNAKVYNNSLKIGAETGSEVIITSDLTEGLTGAQIVYTDVWASMGHEAEREPRLKAFQNYQVNQETLGLAEKNAIVMHCLPAHREEEITSEVMDGPQSVIFDQAENRLHAQKALLAALLA